MSAPLPRARGLVRSFLPAGTDVAVMGRSPRRDRLAGLTVAVVALPLALGFGVSSGLGARAGLPFFAAAHRLVHGPHQAADVRVVILRMSRVSTMDTTGALALKDAVRTLHRRGIVVLASRIRSEHRQVLKAVGTLDLLRHEGHAYTTAHEALAGARACLERAGVRPAVPAQNARTDRSTHEGSVR